jgi:lipopolysaccharide/colanic/teichoic acid biosynthesis glycosyltransferase
MNNSELSTITPSADAFSASSPYANSLSWNNPADDRVQGGDSPSHSGTTCIEESATHVDQSAQVEEAQSNVEAMYPDLGLWLLRDSSTRQDHWDFFKEMLQSRARAGEATVKYSSEAVKRGFDVIVASLLLMMLAPLFLIIAILIKLDSPGPIFFRHNRVGQGGAHFALWKFRSMKTDVPKYEASPRSSVDSRLTRIGKLIRRLSIDELPQLINVLKGEMSIVGPRPEMPFLVARHHPVGCVRSIVKPGITGLWQISPARAFPIHENLQYDIHYINNRNFFLDCAIILRTIAAVIHGVGAV